MVAIERLGFGSFLDIEVWGTAPSMPYKQGAWALYLEVEAIGVLDVGKTTGLESSSLESASLSPYCDPLSNQTRFRHCALRVHTRRSETKLYEAPHVQGLSNSQEPKIRNKKAAI